MDPSSPARGDFGTDLRQIETLRTSRLAAATTSIPKIFWAILLLFAAAASFLSGRETPKRFGIQVNLIHMAAIGLAVGLVIVLNNPFRGETSVDPAIIRNALTLRFAIRAIWASKGQAQDYGDVIRIASF